MNESSHKTTGRGIHPRPPDAAPPGAAPAFPPPPFRRLRFRSRAGRRAPWARRADSRRAVITTGAEIMDEVFRRG